MIRHWWERLAGHVTGRTGGREKATREGENFTCAVRAVQRDIDRRQDELEQRVRSLTQEMDVLRGRPERHA